MGAGRGKRRNGRTSEAEGLETAFLGRWVLGCNFSLMRLPSGGGEGLIEVGGSG